MSLIPPPEFSGVGPDPRGFGDWICCGWFAGETKAGVSSDAVGRGCGVGGLCLVVCLGVLSPEIPSVIDRRASAIETTEHCP